MAFNTVIDLPTIVIAMCDIATHFTRFFLCLFKAFFALLLPLSLFEEKKIKRKLTEDKLRISKEKRFPNIDFEIFGKSQKNALKIN